MVKATPPKGLANTPVIPLPGVWDWVGCYPSKDPGGRSPGGLGGRRKKGEWLCHFKKYV